MKILLNTLYVTTPNAYLSLDGENVAVSNGEEILGRVPLHNLSGIITFGYAGASPALMGKCAGYGIEITFLTQRGRFLSHVVGEVNGNVLLRKEQYRISDDKKRSAEYAKYFLIGKIYNSRWVLERTIRDHELRIEVDPLKAASNLLKNNIEKIKKCKNLDEMRGIEGESASVYFRVFDKMILQQKEDFCFTVRSKRPPLDNVNALLSFVYTLLAHDVSAALSSVGLDPYVGFMHRDRPGRISLALDLMEELRSVLADRFVLTLINKRQIKGGGFSQNESGAVVMDDETRKIVLSSWQSRKQEIIKHPFTDEKVQWGLVPHIQAQLLARCIRGDMDAYPAFLWK